MKRLLILDANNLFIRAFCSCPDIGSDGAPLGGTLGFLRSLQKIVRETHPSMICACWDGQDGSIRRRLAVKEYKEGRKPLKLNRFVGEVADEQQNLENKKMQMVKLIELLNMLPVIQFMLEGCEADDVIGCICQLERFKAGWQRIIVSGDKDFIQLCDSNTVLYRPAQEEVVNSRSAIATYGIHPVNFALARAIAGDKSDNLPGVHAVGLPTVAKRLPFLKEEKSYTISEVVAYCNEQIRASKKPLSIFANIVEQVELVEVNYRVMQLYSPIISLGARTKINDTFNKFVPEYRKFEFQKQLITDGAGAYNWGDLDACFGNILWDHQKKT